MCKWRVLLTYRIIETALKPEQIHKRSEVASLLLEILGIIILKKSKQSQKHGTSIKAQSLNQTLVYDDIFYYNLHTP